MKAKEIKELITAKQAEISRFMAEKRNLTEQYRDALQAEFESERNVKSGDKITTKKGKQIFYDRFTIDAFGDVRVLCHYAKNDGTASKSDRYFSVSDF